MVLPADATKPTPTDEGIEAPIECGPERRLVVDEADTTTTPNELHEGEQSLDIENAEGVWDDGQVVVNPEIGMTQYASNGTLLEMVGEHSESESDEDEASVNGLQKKKEHDCRKHDIRPFSLQNFAFPVHYICTGFVSTLCSGLLYGVLMGTMAVDARIYMTSQTAVASPWGIKCVVGFLSDQFPICGHRRKYYAILGYLTVCLTSLYMTMTFMEPSSFFCTEEHERVDTGDNPSVCNRHAGDDAHVFVLSLMCIVAGLVVADSAADGMMIECAQIERAAETRTAVVVNCFILRVIGASLGSCLLATGFNSYKHLGFFDSDLSLTMFYGIICAVATFSVLLWVVASNAEQPHSQMVPCSRCCAFLHGSTWNSYVAFSRCDTAAKHAGKMLRLFCAKPFFKFMLFNIFSPALSNISTPVDVMVRRYWADVQQMQQQVTTLVTSFVYLVALCMVRSCMLKSNLRRVVAFITIVCVGTNAPISLLTVFGVCRNQYFFLAQDLLDAFPSASMYLVATLITVEIAPVGQEASMYGIVTTAHALAVPVARSVANVLYSRLPTWLNTGTMGSLSDKHMYLEDSDQFRANVAISMCVGFAVAVSALILLPFIPKNQRESVKMRNVPRNKHHLAYGIIIWIIMAVFFASGVTLNVLTVLPSVNCTQLLGGAGCASGT